MSLRRFAKRSAFLLALALAGPPRLARANDEEIREAIEPYAKWFERGGPLGPADAVRAVTKARAELAAAKKTGDPIELRRAQYALDDARERIPTAAGVLDEVRRSGREATTRLDPKAFAKLGLKVRRHLIGEERETAWPFALSAAEALLDPHASRIARANAVEVIGMLTQAGTNLRRELPWAKRHREVTRLLRRIAAQPWAAHDLHLQYALADAFSALRIPRDAARVARLYLDDIHEDLDPRRVANALGWARRASVAPVAGESIARLIDVAGARLTELAAQTEDHNQLWRYCSYDAPGYLDLLAEARHWEKRTGVPLVTDAQFEPFRRSPVKALLALGDRNGNRLSRDARRELLQWAARDGERGAALLDGLVEAHAQDTERVRSSDSPIEAVAAAAKSVGKPRAVAWLNALAPLAPHHPRPDLLLLAYEHVGDLEAATKVARDLLAPAPVGEYHALEPVATALAFARRHPDLMPVDADTAKRLWRESVRVNRDRDRFILKTARQFRDRTHRYPRFARSDVTIMVQSSQEIASLQRHLQRLGYLPPSALLRPASARVTGMRIHADKSVRKNARWRVPKAASGPSSGQALLRQPP